MFFQELLFVHRLNSMSGLTLWTQGLLDPHKRQHKNSQQLWCNLLLTVDNTRKASRKMRSTHEHITSVSTDLLPWLFLHLFNDK